MFGIPGKQAVTLTPKAVAQVLKLMEGKGHVGLRLGVKKRWLCRDGIHDGIRGPDRQS